MPQDVLTFVFVAAVAGAMLFVLGAIIRFGLVSPWLTRGASKRLRHPDVSGLEALVGFVPDDDLVQFYRSWPQLDRSEFYLVNPTTSESWFIGGFFPMSMIDTSEWRKVSGRHGLPIAGNMDKGTYFVQADGRIELWSPHVDGGHVVVAPSIRDLMGFKVASWEEVHAADDSA